MTDHEINQPQAGPADKGFDIRCPYCNSVVNKLTSCSDLVCNVCDAGTIDGVWVSGDE